MDLSPTRQPIAARDHTDTQTLRAALARDDVYMPSELAAQLLPLAALHASEPATWGRPALGADRRSPAH